jgi:hypothetical protein
MRQPDHAVVPMKDHLDQRFADVIRLGWVTAAAIVAGGWIAFSLNSKATAVALDSERRGTKAALDSNNREVETHNGKIRQWEITQAQERATLATKADIAPLIEDLKGRQASALTVGKLVRWLFAALTLGTAVGFGIASLPGIAG